MIAAKRMKNYKKWPNMTKNYKTIDTFEYDCNANNEKKNKNHQTWPKMTKQLTFLNMIAAKIMKNYKKIPKMTKNIDIFEYDCSENNEKL